MFGLSAVDRRTIKFNSKLPWSRAHCHEKDLTEVFDRVRKGYEQASLGFSLCKHTCPVASAYCLPAVNQGPCCGHASRVHDHHQLSSKPLPAGREQADENLKHQKSDGSD